MRFRSKELGDKNIIGENVVAYRRAKGFTQQELLRRLQAFGLEMSNPSLSQLEGQLRLARDYEVSALAKALEVSLDEMYGNFESGSSEEK